MIPEKELAKSGTRQKSLGWRDKLETMLSLKDSNFGEQKRDFRVIFLGGSLIKLFFRCHGAHMNGT